VVLCSALGHEALWSHRAVRFLARGLAAHGIPALRFDYHGTGDAMGVEADPERIQTWLGNIDAAVRRLRDETGVSRVVLLGLRLGGTLAALAGERFGDIDGLVLMAPVIKGSAYLRELSILQASWINTSATHIKQTPVPEGVAETLGHRLYPESAKQVSALDLRDGTVCPASRVLMLEHGVRAPAKALTAHYSELGAEVKVHQFAEYPTVMAETGINQVPVDALEHIIGWIDMWPDNLAPRRAPQLNNAPQPARCLSTPDVIEEPVVFGEGRLFGIHCRPNGGGTPSLAVVFPNTGGNHHVGDARMWVLMARNLAKCGIASLRMDIGSLGDSAFAASASPTADLYNDRGIDDVAQGVAWLRAQHYRKVVAVGVCSGAYLSMRAALLKPGLDGLVLVNQDRFNWGINETGGANQVGTISRSAPTRVHMRSAMQLGKWLRVMRGQTSFWPKLKAVAQRIGQRNTAALRRNLSRFRSASLDSSTGGIAAIRALDARGIKTHFVYGTYDVGLEVGEYTFGSHFKTLRKLPCVSFETHPSIDHALFLYGGREIVWSELQSFLSANFEGAAHVRNLPRLAARPATPHGALNPWQRDRAV
jgi:dienelactone hydrolase